MKFRKPLGMNHFALSEETLQQGAGLEAVHVSQCSVDESLNRGGQRICWATDLEPLAVIRTLLEGRAQAVLQSEPESFQAQIQDWIRLKKNENEYFQNPLKYFIREPKSEWVNSITSIEQKDELRREVEHFAIENGNSACQSSIMALFEELFMNSMIDAPREALKTRSEAQVGATFCMAVDENFLAISCRDPQGSLDLEKLLRRMEEVYRRGAGDAINLRGSGGAGIGCVLMIENVTLICFGVDPGNATVVTCLVPKKLSHKKRSEIRKSIYLIQLQNEKEESL